MLFNAQTSNGWVKATVTAVLLELAVSVSVSVCWLHCQLTQPLGLFYFAVNSTFVQAVIKCMRKCAAVCWGALLGSPLTAEVPYPSSSWFPFYNHLKDMKDIIKHNCRHKIWMFRSVLTVTFETGWFLCLHLIKWGVYYTTFCSIATVYYVC